MAHSTKPPDHSQYLLDFSSRQGDRLRLLRTALKRQPWTDLKHWQLCLMVANYENEHAGLVRDYDELADLLWCNRSTVIRLVNRLADLGLLAVTQTHDADGAARKNEYRLNWETAKTLAMSSVRELGVTVSQSHGATTWSQPATTWWHSATSLKEEIFPGNLSAPVPLPIPEAGPLQIATAPAVPDAGDPSWKAGAGRPGTAWKPPGEDGLRKSLLGEVPELVAAAPRLIAPRPAGKLIYGVWRVLEMKHLRPDANSAIVVWHQQQLSLRAPVAGPTEADLLLTLGGALYAWHLPDSEVRKSRVAAFCNLVGSKHWRRALPYVPEARATLDRLQADSGGAFWLAPAEETTP